jgi:hypothetical protein
MLEVIMPHGHPRRTYTAHPALAATAGREDDAAGVTLTNPPAPGVT